MGTMAERWGFLARWTDALRGRIIYRWPETEEGVWAQRKRFLEVYPPARFESSNVEKELPKKKEQEFLAEIQEFREALALLAAVGHVDKVAWRFLLEHYCDVNFGVEGEEVFEEEIPVRFQLYLLKGRTKYTYPKKLKDDLVRWFGTSQRADASEDFLETLQHIADLAGNLPTNKPGVDVAIPVTVYFSAIAGNFATISGDLKPLEDIWTAEMVVQKQWETFDNLTRHIAVPSGSLRCTFKLEPMVVDFGDSVITYEMVDLMKALVQDNVSFSYVSIWTRLVDGLRQDRFTATHKFGELMGCIFDNEPRPRELSYTNYYPDTTRDESPPLQFGAIDLNCDSDSNFAAMCSALVTNQTTKKISMYLQVNPDEGHGDSAQKWKWVAYAFFSKRARESSALETLALTSIDSLSSADMETFTSIVASDHPEEDLFGCPRGQIPERDATLKEQSPIYWRVTSDGQLSEDFAPLVFDSPIRSVRTFSDDGRSALVNALVPGFGRCLVNRGDLVFSEATTAKTAARGGVSSLFLGFSEEEETAPVGLPLLLAAVGKSLKFLTLNEPSVEVDTNAIVRSCPNLQELALCKGQVEIRFNFGSYHASRQPLPALECDWDNVPELLQRLSDVSSPLAKSARRLRLRVLHQVFWDGMDRTARAISHMLEANHNLEYLDVVLPPDTAVDTVDLRKHHRTPINRALRLSTACKVAFLSVFSPSAPSNPTGNKRERADSGRATVSCSLDEHVLSNILVLAAPPVLRQVYARRAGETGEVNGAQVPI